MAVDYYQRSEAPCETAMCRTCDLDVYYITPFLSTTLFLPSLFVQNTCYEVNATRHYLSEYGSIGAHDIGSVSFYLLVDPHTYAFFI